MMAALSCAIPMRGLPRLSLHIEILTIGSAKLFLRNLVNPWMIALLILSPLPVAYALVVHLLILTMNVLKKLIYALDDSVWGIKITALEESTDFATLNPKKLFSKLKSHKMSRKGCLNHDASHF
jgi:hypothetical protein